MSTIKITYFNSRGRAELSRLILAQAGVEYEDCRIEYDDWTELKKKLPLGQLPVLEVDGKVISQSHTMARYLAHRFKLAGKNDWEAAEADMIVDTCADVGNKMVPVIMEKDEGKKMEMMKTFMEDALPQFLGGIEKVLTSRGGKHFTGSTLSWADIAVAALLSELQNKLGDILGKTPALAALVKTTMDLPRIKKWVETRPKTER